MEQQFVHRNNHTHKTVDSVCVRCFQTVGTRSAEAELEQDEQTHICKKPCMSRLYVCVPQRMSMSTEIHFSIQQRSGII